MKLFLILEHNLDFFQELHIEMSLPRAFSANYLLIHLHLQKIHSSAPKVFTISDFIFPWSVCPFRTLFSILKYHTIPYLASMICAEYRWGVSIEEIVFLSKRGRVVSFLIKMFSVATSENNTHHWAWISMKNLLELLDYIE